MNPEVWAALGCRRAAGESLVSWLRAGPLGDQGLSRLASSLPAGGDLYCPACYMDEDGQRRWYTRESWTAQEVVCGTHAMPLLRCERPPPRLRGRRWPSALREEYRAIAVWTQQGGGGEIGHAIARAVSARSDPRVAYSRAWAEAQWHLWAGGWPVPYAPRLPLQGPLTPTFQFDRLALMAIARRVHVALETGEGTGWTALPVRARVMGWLIERIGRAHPILLGRLAQCFRDARESNTRL